MKYGSWTKSSSLGKGVMSALFRALLLALLWQGVSLAQDLEPRRWTHLPVETNVGGINYLYSTGDVLFDPVLELENVEMTSHSVVASYTRAFELAGTTGRVDVLLPYASAQWEGLLSGAPASTRRDGFADPWIRLSVGLLGTPALEGEEYLKFRAANPITTVVGAALAVMLPLGEYQEDKLLNLGQNRFIIRPQLGITHTRRAWSYELTGSVLFFTDNNDFFGGNTREQDPVFALQTHVVYTFPNRWWTSAGLGYNWGGESEINGQPKDDMKGNLLSTLAVGCPITKTQAIKFGYFRGDAQERVGSDTHNLFLSWNLRF